MTNAGSVLAVFLLCLGVVPKPASAANRGLSAACKVFKGVPSSKHDTYENGTYSGWFGPLATARDYSDHRQAPGKPNRWLTAHLKARATAGSYLLDLQGACGVVTALTAVRAEIARLGADARATPNGHLAAAQTMMADAGQPAESRLIHNFHYKLHGDAAGLHGMFDLTTGNCGTATFYRSTTEIPDNRFAAAFCRLAQADPSHKLAGFYVPLNSRSMGVDLGHGGAVVHREVDFGRVEYYLCNKADFDIAATSDSTTLAGPEC